MDKEVALNELKKLYEEHGYIRVKKNPRQRKVRSGWEIQFVVSDGTEAFQTEEVLTDFGFRPGRPFVKRNTRVVPLYGLAQVKKFLELIQPGVKREIPNFPPEDMRYHYPPKMPDLDLINFIKRKL